MSGAVNFAMSDVYGGVWGTTEQTIPEAADQTALVDDQKAAADVADPASGKKSIPMLISILLVIVVIALIGGIK